MTENEYWLAVHQKYDELVDSYKKRYEKSINTDFLPETVLSEIRPLWMFTNYRIGIDVYGQDVYDGGSLRFARVELQAGKRDYCNRQHLELDALLKFEKFLEGNEIDANTYHLGNTLKKEIKELSTAENLKKFLLTEQIDDFFYEIQAIFADIPYDINKSKEGYFHSHLHLILRLIGFNILSEVSTNIGRIDSVIELTGLIYILEFKIGNSNKALKQITEKKYFQKYQTRKKKKIWIGVNCSDQERNVIDWEVKKEG